MVLLTMTIFSTALAAATSVMAWRVTRREARRSHARVEALAAAIRGPQVAVNMETAGAIASFPSEYSTHVAAAKPASSVNDYRRFATLSGGAFVVAGLLILAGAQRGGLALHNRRTAVPEVSAARETSARSSAQTAAAAPLELIALSHQRGKETLVVRGAIRNPSNGTACEMPAVVVLTFDEDGIFLGSNESDSGETLRPGARATFSVDVPAGTKLPARYRVSFRSAGRVVPHVDKRLPAAAATARSLSAPRVRQISPERS